MGSFILQCKHVYFFYSFTQLCCFNTEMGMLSIATRIQQKQKLVVYVTQTITMDGFAT